ncbi:diguanylate cyclase domain-containing protein [Mycobacterium sp. NPDC003323]
MPRSKIWRTGSGAYYRQQFQLWWNDDVDHTWMLDFLRTRGFMLPLRAVVAAVGVGMGVALLSLQFVALAEPVGVSRGILALMAVAAFVWPVYWLLFPWPSPRTSIVLFLAIDLSIAVAAAVRADPLAGLTSTPLFAVTGIYIMFFHGARATAVHLLIAVVAIIALATRLGTSDYADAVPLAVGKSVISFLVTVFILPFAQFGFWLIRNSSVESLADPLTGLANRRGLRDHVARMIDTEAEPESVCVFVIDIDKFKSVNDRYGHAIGDDVLVQTAAALRGIRRRPAFAARTGGEEFVIVDLLDADGAESVGDRLRAAIAAVGPPAVTASVGAACGPVASMEAFELLLRRADTAMYAAKRGGGDRVVIAD